MQVSRKAGAMCWHHRCTGMLIALSMVVAGRAGQAAELRLLHADPTAVRQTLLPAGRTGTDPTLLLQFDAGGERHALQLHANPGLAGAFPDLPRTVEAFQGRVEGYPDSWAALTRIGGRWTGIWYDGAEYFGVDSAASLSVAPSTALMVYRLRDLVWDEEPSLEDDVRVPDNVEQLAILPLSLVLPENPPSRQLAIAMVADAALAQRHGGDLQANLLAQLNVIDGIFANQLGVRITAGSVTVFDDRSTQPFGNATDAEDLLDAVSNWRARTAAQRQAGLTHLFTGRDLNGRTVGMAYLDSLCSRRFSAGLSQSTGPTSFAALVAAHEIGHVFGAPHDGDTARACAAAPAGYLMSPRISGSQEFSSCSIGEMTARTAEASCLVTLPEGSEWPQEPARPGAQGGSGTLPVTSLVLLGMFAAAGVRRRILQIRANHSAR